MPCRAWKHEKAPTSKTHKSITFLLAGRTKWWCTSFHSKVDHHPVLKTASNPFLALSPVSERPPEVDRINSNFPLPANLDQVYCFAEGINITCVRVSVIITHVEGVKRSWFGARQQYRVGGRDEKNQPKCGPLMDDRNPISLRFGGQFRPWKVCDCGVTFFPDFWKRTKATGDDCGELNCGFLAIHTTSRSKDELY